MIFSITNAPQFILLQFLCSGIAYHSCLKDETLKIFTCDCLRAIFTSQVQHLNISSVLSFKLPWCTIPQLSNYNNMNCGVFVTLRIMCLKE